MLQGVPTPGCQLSVGPAAPGTLLTWRAHWHLFPSCPPPGPQGAAPGGQGFECGLPCRGQRLHPALSSGFPPAVRLGHPPPNTNRLLLKEGLTMLPDPWIPEVFQNLLWCLWLSHHPPGRSDPRTEAEAMSVARTSSLVPWPAALHPHGIWMQRCVGPGPCEMLGMLRSSWGHSWGPDG